MMEKSFYVYCWFNLDTHEIFYIGKGSRDRCKTLRNRNSLFLEYIERNRSDYAILEYYSEESRAFAREQELIASIQPSCNIALGGFGGYSIVWTEELREWKSKNNPMKSPILREKMSKNNPMKNKDIAYKVNSQKRKIPIINNIEYLSVDDACNQYKVCKDAMYNWCKRGYNTLGESCYYKGNKPISEIPSMQHPCSKKVVIDGIIFNSVKEGANYINTDSGNLIRAMKLGRPCKGHKCEYANQQPSQENINETSILEGSETNS